METTKVRFLYEDVLDQIEKSKWLTSDEKQRSTKEINEMLEKGQIKMVPAELTSGVKGNLGVIFTWATSPSGWAFWNKINSRL